MVSTGVARGSTRDEASARAERIRQGLQSYAVLREDIATAYRARDWIALGYASWDQYVEAEFTTAARLSLPRDERRELVAYFREQGMSTRAIAAATGAHQETVVNDLKQVNGIRSPAVSNVVGMDGKTYTATAPQPDVVDAAIEKAEAEAEGNLSRANVVRKVRVARDTREEVGVEPDPPSPVGIPASGERGPQVAARRRELIAEWAGKSWTSRQIGERLGIRPETVRRIARAEGIAVPADEVVGRTRKVDSNRIVRTAVDELAEFDMALNMVRFEELDRTEIPNWTTSLTASIRVLNRLNKKLKEMVQ